MTLLTVKELMTLLRVKRSTLYALRDQGLPAIRLGRSIRFDQDEVEAWVRRQRLAPGAPLTFDEGGRAAAAASVSTGLRLTSVKA